MHLQRPHPDVIHTQRESLEHTALNGKSPLNPSPQGLGNPTEEEAGSVRARGNGGYPKYEASKLT